MNKQEHHANVVSILNFKGGVGKTTTALNLGAALAMNGKRTLIIDIDVQMNSSFILGYDTADGENVYDLMKGTARSYPIYGTNLPELSFIPASMKLSTLAIEIADRISRETILRRQLEPLRALYDYILIDCPPGKGVLTDNALCASDNIIVPLTCEIMALQGVSAILAKVGEIQQLVNPDLKIMGFLLTKHNAAYKVGKIVRNTLEQEKVPVFDTTIRNSMPLNTYCDQYQSVFELDKNCTGAQDYMALAKEIIKINKD